MRDAPYAWMELEIERSGGDLRIAARGSRDERPLPHLLGAGDTLASFTAGVKAAAARGRMSGAALVEARQLHRALFREGVEHLRARLAEVAAGAPLLVRFLIRDPELQAIPWEALCDPSSAMGFLGTSPDLLPVRGVTTSDPWQPGVVRGALRVLAIAPQGGRSAFVLQSALSERIASGEIEWLDPLVGPGAEVRNLFARLRREPSPHVIHFLGHGGLMDGFPALRLADTDGEENWLPVELLAQQLRASFRGQLHLVVLEACEGARPSAFASAAEILARAGADAVVAHLWPVQADVARLCSEQIYRTLAGSAQATGDIAVSLNEARRAVLGAFGGTAEAFSPVLYLRGTSGVLFDFAGRAGAASDEGRISIPAPSSQPQRTTLPSPAPVSQPAMPHRPPTMPQPQQAPPAWSATPPAAPHRPPTMPQPQQQPPAWSATPPSAPRPAPPAPLPIAHLRPGAIAPGVVEIRKAGALPPPLPEPHKPGAISPQVAAEIRKTAPSLQSAALREQKPGAVEIEPAPLSRTPLPTSSGVNRVCTVLVIDLSGTAALATRLDPGELKEVIDACTQKVKEQIEAMDGVASRLGVDSLVCAFGAVRASENDAERAVVAALHIREALAKIPLPRAARAFRPAARIGISTGRVFAERSPGAPFTLIGEAVTAATRLQQTAQPGAIVIGRDTCRQVLTRFQFQALPHVEIPGFSEPMPAYLVVGPMSFRHGLTQEGFYGLETKLIGRDAERKRLIDTLDEVVQKRRAALVTITSAPGAGRTRMLAELFSSIATDKSRYLINVAEGSALAMAHGYGMVASLLRRRFGSQESDAPERILHVLRRGVRWLRLHTAHDISIDDELSSLDVSIDETLRGRDTFDDTFRGRDTFDDAYRARDSLAASGPMSRSYDERNLDDALVQLAGVLDVHTEMPSLGDAVRPDEKGANAKQRVIAAAATLIRFAASRRPVVILCDDVHWADDASLDILDELVVRSADLPLLVVCTARPELFERRPHWGEGNPAHRRIELGPLDRRAIEEMIRDRLRLVRDLSPGLVRLLVDRSDNSPLILDETMRLLVDAGVIEVREGGGEQLIHEARLGALSLPTTVQGLVQARLDRLEPDTRAVLERAAVVGRTFWDGAVDQLRQGDGPKTADVISSLRERQLVRTRDTSTFPGENERVFTESATQEVAYENIPARVRRPMHRRIAKWLKTRAPGSAEAALIALHYDRAGDLWGAAEQYTRAAAYAMSLGHNAEARRLLTRLREIHDESDAAGPVNFSRSAPMISWRDKVRLGLDLGDVQRRLGLLDEAAGEYDRARKSIIVKDPDAPKWEARTDFRIALLLKVRGHSANAGKLVERAIARANQAGIASETPAMFALLTEILRRDRRHNEGWRMSLLGLRACRSIPRTDPRRPESAARALLGMAPVLYQKKRLVACERTYLQAARLAEKSGDLEALGRAWNGVAAARAAMGQHARARATYVQSLRIKERAGDLHEIAIAYTNVAELEIEMKDLAAALSHAKRGVSLAEQIHAESDLAEGYRILSEAALALGKVEEALTACLRALAIGKTEGRLYLDEVVLSLARITMRAAEEPALRARAEEARAALRDILTQGFLDGDLRERVEISLAMIGEYLS